MNKTSPNTIKDFRYDVAFSLCKEDVAFTRKLVKELNPGLKVFFYETRQEELITKSGPEAFAKIFSKESRIVVVLSRKSWSETYYTDIERNAIIDRTSVKNEGYGFLMVFPMIPGEKPEWYPSTKIYADPTRFTVGELARFIEFKISQFGGVVNPLNAVEHYENIRTRIEEKTKTVDLQRDSKAIDAAYTEVDNVKEAWKEKLNSLSSLILKEYGTEYQNGNPYSAILKSNWHALRIVMKSPDRMRLQNNSTCQDFQLHISIMKWSEQEYKFAETNSKRYVFYYNPPLLAWGELLEKKKDISNRESKIFYKSALNPYPFDIISQHSIGEILDQWFIEFIDATYQDLTPHI